MRKPLLILMLLMLAAPVHAAERGFSVSDFDAVHVTGPYTVDVRPGRATIVKARGSARALESVSVRTMGRALVIEPIAGSFNSTDSGPPPAFLITLPRLIGARLLGSGSLTVAELRGAAADVALTGTGTVTVTRAATDRLTLRQAGEGRLTISGKTLSLEASSKGAGSIEAAGLSASDIKLNAATSGSVRMTATRSANIVSTGPGIVEISGTRACAIQNRGSGEVRCER
jgi:hypothetical protein